MKFNVAKVFIGLLFSVGLGGTINAQTDQIDDPDWPDWAYGFLAPLEEGDQIAWPCPTVVENPRDCRRPAAPDPDDGIKHTLPGTDKSFTSAEANYGYGPADWYPGDHPAMPDIVAYGNEDAGIRACSLCHYPNGQGKMENGHVAGLPAEYIFQQLDAFERGDRRNADQRKENTNEMSIMPKRLTDEEKQQIAEYFSSIPFRQWVQVIEAEEVPQVRVGSAGGLMVPIPNVPLMPLGNRIIEVPEYPERTEIMRDPRVGFVTYVPIGSLEKGENLVTTGGGKTFQCSICHGTDHRGIAAIPPIAGRTASYTMRQLWDFKQGTRVSPLMAPVVANLTSEDMMHIVAYLASLPPSEETFPAP